MGFTETMIFYLLIGAGVATAVFLSDARPNRLVARVPGGDGRGLLAVVPADPAGATASPARTGNPPRAGRWRRHVADHRPGRGRAGDGAGQPRRLGRGRAGPRDRPLPRAELRLARSGGTDSRDGPLARPSGAGRPRRDTRAPRGRRRATAAARASRPVARTWPGSARFADRAYEDLMGTLTWVRELVSMIHLAKFTGAPASRAEELVAQIAAAVEGISAVTWQEAPPESTVLPTRPDSITT